MTKSEIRSFVKGLVRGISVEERTRFSEALKEEVVGLECWRSAKEVMLFFSLPDEVDMLPLIRAALAEQKRIYLPRVIATQVRWQRATRWQWGVHCQRRASKQWAALCQ